jgi:hypothetical protein
LVPRHAASRFIAALIPCRLLAVSPLAVPPSSASDAVPSRREFPLADEEM